MQADNLHVTGTGDNQIGHADAGASARATPWIWMVLMANLLSDALDSLDHAEPLLRARVETPAAASWPRSPSTARFFLLASAFLCDRGATFLTRAGRGKTSAR